MKLSSKARYGLKAVIELAKQKDNIISLAYLATLTGVSEGYLEQLFSLLRKSNIVSSVRGAGGGYSLVGQPADIRCGDIVRALEDELEIVDCISGECEDKCSCSTHKVWTRVYEAINMSLDEITLDELIKE